MGSGTALSRSSTPAAGRKTWPLRLAGAALSAIALWVGIATAPSGGQEAGPQFDDAGWLIHDPTNRLADSRAEVEEQLDVIAFRGWRLHLYLLEQSGPVDRDALNALVVTSDDPTLAARSVALFTTAEPEPDDQLFLPGGGDVATEASEFYPDFAARYTLRRASQPPLDAFFGAVEDIIPETESDAGGSGSGSGGGPSVRGLLTLVMYGMPVLTAAALLYSFRPGRNGPKYYEVAALRAGMKVIVDGTVTADQARPVPGEGIMAAFVQHVTQSQQVDSTPDHLRHDRHYVRRDPYAAMSARETWSDSRVDSEWSAPVMWIDDGTGSVPVTGPGYREGTLVHVGGSTGGGNKEYRSVVYAIPIGGQATARGYVHTAPDGTLYIAGGPKQKLYVTSRETGGGLLAQRLYGAVFCVGFGVVVTAAAWFLRGL